MQPLGCQIDVSRLYTGNALQAAFDQPHAGSAMDAFDQQMNVAHIAGAGGEFLLHLVEVVDFDVFGRLWRRREQRAFRCALVIALQTRLQRWHCITDWQPKQQNRRSAPSSRAWIVRLGSDGQAAVKAVARSGIATRASNYLSTTVRSATMNLVGIDVKHLLAALDAHMQFPITLQREVDISLISTGSHFLEGSGEILARHRTAR